jgi:heat shock protein HslJ
VPAVTGTAWHLERSAWRVDDVAGTGTVDRVQPTIEFAEGRLFGSGGVNRFNGGYTLDGDRLIPGPAMSTLMAGSPEQMDQEHRWLKAIGQPSTLRAGEVDSVLYLDHDDGTTSRLVLIVRPTGSA